MKGNDSGIEEEGFNICSNLRDVIHEWVLFRQSLQDTDHLILKIMSSPARKRIYNVFYRVQQKQNNPYFLFEITFNTRFDYLEHSSYHVMLRSEPIKQKLYIAIKKILIDNQFILILTKKIAPLFLVPNVVQTISLGHRPNH